MNTSKLDAFDAVAEYVEKMMTANYWYERARDFSTEHPFYRRGVFYDGLARDAILTCRESEQSAVRQTALDIYNAQYKAGRHNVNQKNPLNIIRF